MSNLFKSFFVTYEEDRKLIKVDQNDPRIINAYDEMTATVEEVDVEENQFAEELESLEELLEARRVEDEKNAALIIQEAKASAVAILEEAREQSEKLKAVAYEEGKAEGYDAGYREGLQKAQEIVDSAEQEKIQQQVAYEDLLKTVEPKVAYILIAYLEKLTGVLLESKEEVICYLVNMALHDEELSGRLLIKVSPLDFEYLDRHRDEIIGSNNTNLSIDILADSKLEKGQCLIETDNGIINSSLDVQMKGLIEDIKMLGGL